jgi:hypothetical protein
MTDTAGGKGAAHNPTIVVEDSFAALDAAAQAAREREEAERAATEPARNIASLEAGIAKLEGHLAHHHELLDAAKAAAEAAPAAEGTV